MTTLLLTQIPVWAGVILVLYWICCLVFLVDQDREPTSTLAWLFVLLFLPFIGILFYYFFGRDWHERTPSSKWAPQCGIVMKEGMRPIYARNLDARTRFQDTYAGSWVEDISAAIAADDLSHPLPASSVEIYGRTADFFGRLRRDLAAARSFIHLQYFIWERDELTAEITGILLERVAAGVEVRILYDNLGSRRYGKDELQRLARAGARVTADVVERSHLNYRDHRKVAVIDGEIGYTGGSNMGQEYIDGGTRFSVWRDTNVRISGQAVAELQKLFASRWYVDHKGEDLLIDRYLPGPDGAAAAGGHLTQLVAHTHEGRWQASRRAHMIAIAKAEKTAYIQSPYFIPDAGMYDAMINAGLSGVDIRFMMAGVPDRARPVLGGPDLLRPAALRRRAGLPLRGRLHPRQDDHGRFHSGRGRHDEHGHPQHAPPQGAHALALRLWPHAPAGGALHGRRHALSRSDPRRRPRGVAARTLSQPGLPAAVEPALRGTAVA